MPTINHYYVDPQNGSDSTGDGTIGDPWASIQKALTDGETAANGIQVNVRDQGVDVTTAELDYSSLTIDEDRPAIIRGYTSAANDGGVGTVSGGGNHTITSGTRTIFIDMHLTDTGSSTIASGSVAYYWRCKFSLSTGIGLDMPLFSTVCVQCHFTDIARPANLRNPEAIIRDCYIERVTGSVIRAIDMADNTCTAARNIVDLRNSDSGSIGIHIRSRRCRAFGNIIVADGGTGVGINVRDDTSVIENNIVAGFSGSGGRGLDSNSPMWVFRRNHFYNNTTDGHDAPAFFAEGNAQLTADPFVDAANGDFNLNDAAGGGAVLRGVSFNLP